MICNNTIGGLGVDPFMYVMVYSNVLTRVGDHFGNSIKILFGAD